jgi:hypothetical protein
MSNLRLAAAVALLAFQLLSIAHARRVPTRYFCWAPYDVQTEYWLEASVGDRVLLPDEVRARYRRPAHGFDNRSPHHLIDILEGVEERLPAHEQARIRLRYTRNGKPQPDWTRTPRP